MGSEEALSIVESIEGDQYPEYSTNMTKLRTYVDEQGTDIWTQNIYWGWLYTLMGLLPDFS